MTVFGSGGGYLDPIDRETDRNVVPPQGIPVKAPFLKVISDRNLVGEHSLL